MTKPSQTLQSMTAFASHAEETAYGRFQWELRSVNHRYFDLSLRLPESLRALEPELRKLLHDRLGRGRVEASLRFEPSENAQEIQVNQGLVQQLQAALDALPMPKDGQRVSNGMDLLRWPGVLSTVEKDKSALMAAAMAVLSKTADELQLAREREGESLKQLLLKRLDEINSLLQPVLAQADTLTANYRAKLQQRLAELEAKVDVERMEQELVLLAQKVDIAEELDRLATHVTEIQRCLQGGGMIGRRLDFLIQELNREANTMASKSINQDTSQAAVALKVVIEQMREQVQNIA